MRDCTAYSLQGILICYFGSLPVWETVLPVLFKEFLFDILDLSLYERLYCLFSSRNSYLLSSIFPCMRDCTACSLQGILICYCGSFPVWETVLRILFKEFLFAILDLCRYERLYCLFSSRNSYLLFWIFPCMRDCAACSLQGILICYFGPFPCMRDETASSLQGFLCCYFGSFPVWEIKLPLPFKDFLFVILDLSLYARWNCLFSSRIPYLLFWIFPCMRDENASSFQGNLICYFGSFHGREMKLPVLFKVFLFAILDLSLYERLYCLFSTRNSYLLFWIFPCMRDCTACSLQGILICYFGSFPVWETVLRILFKEFLFAILDLCRYERLYCLFSSRNSYLLFWIFPCMRDCTACSLQGILNCYCGSFPVWETVLRILFKVFLFAIFISFPVWETVLRILFKEFLFAILDLSLYERLYCLFSSRNTYLLFWIFPCMRDCTAYSLQGILICYFGSLPVWETVLPVLLKEFLFAILDLSLYERLYCLFSSRNS